MVWTGGVGMWAAVGGVQIVHTINCIGRCKFHGSHVHDNYVDLDDWRATYCSVPSEVEESSEQGQMASNMEWEPHWKVSGGPRNPSRCGVQTSGLEGKSPWMAMFL